MSTGSQATSSRRYTCLIVDDEPPARAELRTLVSAVPWLHLVGEAKTGPDAVGKIDALEPDLVFLDIEMPGISGLDVIADADHHPMVVFTTAYSQHAVSAFGLDALDYLLKPFGQERFRTAMDRAKKRLDAEVRDRHGEVLLDGHPARRLFVRDRGRLIPVDVPSIIRFEADDDYVRIHTAEREFLVYARLKELQARLDASVFLRVHRSHLVNVHHIVALVPHPGGRFKLEFEHGPSVIASRRRSRGLRKLVL